MSTRWWLFSCAWKVGTHTTSPFHIITVLHISNILHSHSAYRLPAHVSIYVYCSYVNPRSNTFHPTSTHLSRAWKEPSPRRHLVHNILPFHSTHFYITHILSKTTNQFCSWPAAPNLVKQSCFRVWYHTDQLSVETSRVIEVEVVVDVECMTVGCSYYNY